MEPETQIALAYALIAVIPENGSKVPRFHIGDAMTATANTCPTCRQQQLRHVTADRWECRQCGKRLRLVHTGRFVPFIDYITAGTPKARR